MQLLGCFCAPPPAHSLLWALKRGWIAACWKLSGGAIHLFKLLSTPLHHLGPLLKTHKDPLLEEVGFRPILVSLFGNLCSPGRWFPVADPLPPPPPHVPKFLPLTVGLLFFLACSVSLSLLWRMECQKECRSLGRRSPAWPLPKVRRQGKRYIHSKAKTNTPHRRHKSQTETPKDYTWESFQQTTPPPHTHTLIILHKQKILEV